MEQDTSRNVRLGLFVTIGTLFLIVAFYFVGSKQNLFGNTFRLNARFYNVNGLMQGNNVRFAGIDIGTVESLEIENDSSVRVVMLLDKAVQRFIRKGAVARVGTDGLMGNKLVNITGGVAGMQAVKEGDEISTLRPVEMDEMIRTLNITNNNMALISSNLSDITGRFGNKNTFWKLLMDTLMAENIQASVGNLKDLSEAGKSSAYHLRDITSGLSGPRSSIGRIFADTIIYTRMVRTINNLQRTADTAGRISDNLSAIAMDLKHGKGSVGQALRDTQLIYRLNKGITSVDSAAFGFNENMKALQHTWPLKHYFKKKNRNKK